jgi:hypothetical protein
MVFDERADVFEFSLRLRATGQRARGPIAALLRAA